MVRKSLAGLAFERSLQVVKEAEHCADVDALARQVKTLAEAVQHLAVEMSGIKKDLNR